MEKRHIFWCILIISVTSFAYSNTFHNDFAYDDNFAILDNGDVSYESNFTQIWFNDYWGADISSISSHKSYRPITILTFKLNAILHHWFLQSDVLKHYYLQLISTNMKPQEKVGAPELYHFVNLILHIMCTLLTALFYSKIFPDFSRSNHNDNGTPNISNDTHNIHKQSKMKSSPTWREGVAIFMPPSWAICALLFGLHPIHTEAITGIVGRAEPLCAVFLLLSLYCYASSGREGRSLILYLLLCILSCVFYALSILSKETGFTAIAIFIIYEVLFFSGENIICFWRRNHKLRSLFRFFILLSLSFSYLLFRNTITVHFTLSNYRKLENPIPYLEDDVFRWISILYLHWNYFVLLVKPWPLSADYSFNCIPLIESWSDHRIIYPALLYSCFISFCIYYLFYIFKISFTPHNHHIINTQTLRHHNSNNDNNNNNNTKNSNMKNNITTQIGSSNISDNYCKKREDGNNNFDLQRQGVKGIIFGVSLMIIPFIPASNIMLYVGTFIGERLLYIPSIGFVMLVTYFFDYLFYLIFIKSKRNDNLNNNSNSNNNNNAYYNNNVNNKKYVSNNNNMNINMNNNEKNSAHFHDSGGRNSFMLMGITFKVIVIVVVLSIYYSSTYERNFDWRDEESLFLKALETCYSSAKVQENYGILLRRHNRLEESIRVFNFAREIWPDFCEVDHWIGSSYFELTRYDKAIEHFHRAVRCEYTAVKATLLLNSIYEIFRNSYPHNPDYWVGWTDVLLYLNRTHDAALYYQSAGSLYLTHMANFQKAVECLNSSLRILEREEPRDESAACSSHYYLGIAYSKLNLFHSASYHLWKATSCSGTQALALHSLLEIQSSNSYDPLIHKYWARSILSIGDYVQAVNHFHASASLFVNSYTTNLDLKDLDLAIESLSEILEILEYHKVENVDSMIVQRQILELKTLSKKNNTKG